jgi:glyoxylase-like metal-dependent hydrolase (beta-lactamase superfamily II)
MTLTTRPVGAWAQNACVLVCAETSKSVLIDPGDEPEILSDMLDGTDPQAILVTHGHPDHIGALHVMRESLGVPVLAHPGDGTRSFEADRWIGDGDRLAVGRHHLKALHTPGHTPDHLCFSIEGDHRIIVGDAVFKGGPGKTCCPEGFKTTLHTLRCVILRWPDDAVCYPGHGDPFRLGDIRSSIKRFLQRDHGAFFGDAEWDQ